MTVITTNNVPKVIPQVGFGEGGVDADLTPTMKVEKLFQ